MFCPTHRTKQQPSGLKLRVPCGWYYFPVANLLSYYIQTDNKLALQATETGDIKVAQQHAGALVQLCRGVALQ